MSVDANKAMEYGMLILAAYAIKPEDLNNLVGQAVPQPFDPYGNGYVVRGTIYGIDPKLGNSGGDVSYGLVVQDKEQNVVVALRGTVTGPEWVADGTFSQLDCPIQNSVGRIHSGFNDVYMSLYALQSYGHNRLVYSLIDLPTAPVASMTICGHSLGSALATLLALDVAINGDSGNPCVYTFASPRVGNREFAELYDTKLPNTVRLVNVHDVVPEVPPPLLYRHVSKPINLDPIGVQANEACMHDMNTYLAMLTQLGAVVHPHALAAGCLS